MPHYHYIAIGPDARRVAGAIQAGSVTEATAALEGQGLRVQSISVADDAPQTVKDQAVAGPKVVSPLAPPIEQLLSRRADLVPALRAYAADAAPASIRSPVQKLAAAIEGQDARAIEACVTRAPACAIPLLGAVAAGRTAAEIVSVFDEQARAAAELKRQGRWRLAYPATLVGIGMLVLLIVSATAGSTYRSLFDEFGLAIPIGTQLVLALLDAFASGRAFLWLAIGSLAVYGVRRSAGFLPVRLLHLCELLAPFRLGKSLTVGRLAEYTSCLIEAGLARGEAVRIAGAATGRLTLADSARRFADHLQPGGPEISTTQHQGLTAPVAYALTADLSQSARVRLMREIAACHSDTARLRMPYRSGYMGPITLLLVGLFVLFVVLALFAPVIALIDSLN